VQNHPIGADDREAADAGLVGDDDAQLVAATGHAVTVVEGEPANIKLTTPEDLGVVEALIKEQEAAAASSPFQGED